MNAFFLVLQRQSLLLSHNKFCLQNDIQVLGRLSLSLSQKISFPECGSGMAVIASANIEEQLV